MATFKTEITRMFLKYTKAKVDNNLVLTAVLLCNCKKPSNFTDMNIFKSYAKEGANYLEKLYNSIIQNLNSGLEAEWLIMDDGSQDETSKVVGEFIQEEKVQIKYYNQENQGKTEIKGDKFFIQLPRRLRTPR